MNSINCTFFGVGDPYTYAFSSVVLLLVLYTFNAVDASGPESESPDLDFVSNKPDECSDCDPAGWLKQNCGQDFHFLDLEYPCLHFMYTKSSRHIQIYFVSVFAFSVPWVGCYDPTPVRCE